MPSGCKALPGYNLNRSSILIGEPTIVKYFTDVPYYCKYIYEVDNTNTENYSLGLCTISKELDFTKILYTK